MDSIKEQCKALYIDAFQDDLEFTNLLFDTLFESSCRYLLEGESVVSMLFAIDVTLCGENGKYIYAVATDKAMRGKGYMRVLFDKITDEFKEEYAFLCLRPMSEDLFDFYEKLNFERRFKKSYVKSNGVKNDNLTSISDIDTIRKIRKSLIKENYVEYSDEFYRLLTSYCDFYCDNEISPSVFVVNEKLSLKVKEVLGDYSELPEIYSDKDLLTNGYEFDYAMIKPLNNKKLDGYLGYALD